MNQTIHLEINKDEATRLSEMLDRCVAAMRESNEYGERKQVEIKRLSAETRALQEQTLTEMNRHFAARAYDHSGPAAKVRASSQPNEIEILKTQVIELWAVIRKAEAQRTHDQAEIETLKAQMAALSANPLKQNF